MISLSGNDEIKTEADCAFHDILRKQCKIDCKTVMMNILKMFKNLCQKELNSSGITSITFHFVKNIRLVWVM